MNVTNSNNQANQGNAPAHRPSTQQPNVQPKHLPNNPQEHDAEQQEWSLATFFQSLTVQLSALILVMLILVSVIAYVTVETIGRLQIQKASEEFIRETGDEAINSILSRTNQISGFVESLSGVTSGMPYDLFLFQNTFKSATNHLPEIAIGTGFAFDAYKFDRSVDRRNNYWFRGDNGFQLTTDYENPQITPENYLGEWWYAPVRYMKSGSGCSWTPGYTDPVSKFTMVTCSRPILNQVTKKMDGVVTVDVDPNFLQSLVGEIQQITGGYVFIVDQGNKFITFPDVEMVKKDDNFISVADLARKEAVFKPIADELNQSRLAFNKSARDIDPKRFDEIVQGMMNDSKKITQNHAEDQAAAILTSEKEKGGVKLTYEDAQIHLDKDYFLKESAEAFLFRVPGTFWHLVVVKPDSEINALADTLSKNLLTAFLVSLLVLLPVSLLMLYILFGRPMKETSDGVENITKLVRKRQFNELRVNKLSNVSDSEIGKVGQSMNQLIDSLVHTNVQLEAEAKQRINAQNLAENARKKAEAENEQLNDSVIRILQSVQLLSQRDLTVKAPVTEDIIGTVSDSINYLTDETSQVLKEVTKVAEQVQLSSEKVMDQASVVSQTAQQERENVDSMIESLYEATETMNRVAELAEDSNEAATKATEVTDNALHTVNGTVKGMESIRETIAETEKRIKRLGERSQEISGIVNLINTISERTHVLALNASMQAAVAGEAGRGFAVVAEEVQRLAESSQNATQQIASLVANIQIETKETINTVNNTITQVVEGSSQAQKAGEQMKETQQITEQLVEQVHSIALASEKQKTMSAELLKAVQQIGESTQQTAEQIDAQNKETESLQFSAQRLVESVGVFKLPS